MSRRHLATLICLLLPLCLGGFALAEDEPENEEPKAADDKDRAEIIAMVDELRSVAAEIRGLEWKFKVPADLLTREQLAANLKKMVKEELTPEELERETKVIRRLGLISEDEDPLKMVLAFLEAGVGGYFDPDKKRLFMIDGLKGEAQKPIILHELIHALEDQYIDLKKRTDPIKFDPDRLFADKVLVEGSAEMARIIYENKFPDAARANVEGSNREGAGNQMQVLRITPLFLFLPTILHYRTGPNFVMHALEPEEYAQKMTALYENPPTTQEQALHPSRWLGENKDYPRTIVWGGDFAAVAGEGWTKLHEVPVGELDMALYVDFFLGEDNGRATGPDMAQGNYVSEESVAVANGWDAGRSIFIENGERIGVIEGFSFDSLDDAKEAYDAFTRCLEKAGGDTWKTEGVDHGLGKPAGEAPDVQALDFTDKHGAGRILLRGAELLIAHGFTKEELGNVWTCVRKTKFVKDARDTGDENARIDPFAGYDFVDRDRLFGVKLVDGWKADAPPPAMRAQIPLAVTMVSKGAATMLVILIDQGQSEAALTPSIGMILKNFGIQVDETKLEKSVVAGMPGVAYPFMGQTFHLASDGVRTLLVREMGTAADAATADEAKQILKNMKAILGY